MSAIARRARVTGQVQGVFFRAWAREEARRLGVSGWVRNCPDGSVEAHLEGAAEAVESLVALLHDGPPHARVNRVETQEAPHEGLPGFDIRH